MYKDIISYELAEGVTEEDLMQIAGEIVNDWMKKLPGFISWEINQDKDGSYSDIVSWQDAISAKNAEKEMVNIPNANKWFGCYKTGSISSKNIARLIKF